MCRIFVAEDKNLGARQTASINDGRVIQLIRDDEVILSQQCRHRSRIRRKPRLENNARFDILEARNLLFQFHVDLHRPGNGAHRA